MGAFAGGVSVCECCKNAFGHFGGESKFCDPCRPVSLKLNLACGQDIREGYVNVDFAELAGVDLVRDLEVFPWPWESGAVDEIHCSHYIEHTSDLIRFMDECWRVLKVGGQMTVIAPYYTSMRAWQDPTHKRAISEATFLYFNRAWREANRLEHYRIASDFDFAYGYSLDPEWANREESARNFAIKHYFNTVLDIHLTLTRRG